MVAGLSTRAEAMSSAIERKLTTILAADAAEFTRQMGEDEEGTLAALRSARAIFAKFIERHRGRIANTAGDGMIAEFPSVVEAVQCALEVQQELRSGNMMRFRIGVHLGDVMVDGDDLLGDGVNLAARLQTMAEPGGILISQQVYDQVHSKLPVSFDYLGEKRPKNIDYDIPIYRVFSGKTARRPKAERAAPPTLAKSPGEHHKKRVFQRALALGGIWLIVAVINLATGGPFWAIWPAIAIAVMIGWEFAPLLVKGHMLQTISRGIVLSFALVVINIITWTGYPWALWPIGALVAIELLRRLRRSTA